ncbi:DUF349 domain-containing protein [Flavobacterium daejeonense]|uniref:DUF349 domain-containing protein n=1 Tax=Flavobacterium daejeonense TaxID=350893 RepID=UPI00047ED827|nr:DUF349 domain-containing protein [Flavobacterium daejeonense]
MLEEMNDNLSPKNNETDGNLATDVQADNQATPNPETNDAAPSAENDEAAESLKKQKALSEIEASNAEEHEDETLKGRHEIPMRDYETLSMEVLVEELQKLVTNEKVMSIRDHVEEIKKAFLSKYNHFIEEKREEFLADNPNTTEEFEYHLPLKNKFDQFYTLYRDNKNVHFKNLQNSLKANLENRLAIVEELKELINPNENIKDTFKHFNELRERWKNAGPIPKDKYNHVWNNYHFHVENFYDYLHLDREARDLDFKHNLEQKQKIISRVEELLQEVDVNKAFRELQDLHRIWKEEVGPVSKEYRDEIWNQFSDLTKKMHDKREVLFEKMRGTEQENLEKKNAIIAQIEELATIKVNAHSQWLVQIEKVEALREAFFSTGKVPADVNEATWAAFKTAVRNFNAFKNAFYKDIKKEQNENLNKKNALVAKATELKDSEDFAATTPIMKQIQEDWKKIGHVPRKYSDKVWAEFKDACNHYFDRLKEQKNEHLAEEMEAFDKKKAYLESIKEFQLIGDHKTDLDAIKQHIENWKSIGKVPFTRRHIEGKFNKILDALFDKLSLSKKDSDMMRFANKLENLSESHDNRKLENEKIFIIRKIEEVQNEIFQLENNIQFFANTKNSKKENSIVTEVRKNIAIHKESLDTWKEKLKQLRNLGQEE